MAGAPLKAHWFYILLALATGERHGLAIARDVQALSGGRVRLWPATLYGSLEELRDGGLIAELAGPRERPADESERKRYYRLTRAGRTALAAEGERMGRLARLARTRARTGETG
jgi:DNA-binding PadR family transcriptional regulator